ncbi:hypothetical protein [Sneathia sanguinegens]|uniref:hypothetical protein n=1 Tax=Sneathia sanguinegens TaxID=40543 RepID=UPI0023F72767|nr:hypothetical protein [Sneathia sanguinegens]
MFKVKKINLLIIAGLIWCVAGFNVARLGVISYMGIENKWYLYLLSFIIFIIFGSMFYKMSQKHTERILSYDDYVAFWNFFDVKSYIIMIIMMGGGIGLRVLKILPEYFVAFFYSGLGCALLIAGIIFIKNWTLLIRGDV